ncbi:MAG: ACP S-malonyltransferase [Victivallales bacterium]|nr:ACP S-malonyltransferase [Victivallales bacterium]
MGEDLYASSPAAASVFEKADAILGWSVSEICFKGPDEKLTESRYCQPAIYTMSAACLAAFFERHSDVKPLATSGLSLGEFAALCASGVFAFEDGLRLVARRGELMDIACRQTSGSMASVLGGTIEVVTQVCEECGVDVANLNCPGQIVISGESVKVEKAIKVLKEKGLRKIIPLNVAGAFHSRLMQGAADEFASFLAGFKLFTPSIPVAQNVCGSFVCGIEDIRENLIRQISGSVLWEKCVKAGVGTGARQVIEFGPGNVLTGLIKRTDANVATYNANSLESIENFR